MMMTFLLLKTASLSSCCDAFKQTHVVTTVSNSHCTPE